MNYKHKLEEFAGRNCIIIEDLNSGRSVTNDIENIVAEISGKEHIDPAHFMIVYKDSDGKWDGWDHINNEFVSLQCDNAYHAIRRYVKKQLNTDTIIHNKTIDMKRSNDPGDTQEDDENDGTGALVD